MVNIRAPHSDVLSISKGFCFLFKLHYRRTMQCALCTHTPSYFDCLGHQDFKYITFDGLQELFGVGAGRDGNHHGMYGSYPSDCYNNSTTLYSNTCNSQKYIPDFQKLP